MGTLRNEYVSCGKESCRGCPHGPYWYEYFRERIGRKKWRTWKRYLGKQDPRKEKLNVPEERVWEECPEQLRLAYIILGAEHGMTRQEVHRTYVLAKVQCDPARPNEVLRLQMIEHAWAIIRRENRWS